MTDLVLNFNECYLLQFRLKQPFHLTEPCQSVISKLCEALLCLLYVFFAVEMSFREELVGKAYQLLFQTNRQHIAMRNRKVLFFNLFQ